MSSQLSGYHIKLTITEITCFFHGKTHYCKDSIFLQINLLGKSTEEGGGTQSAKYQDITNLLGNKLYCFRSLFGSKQTKEENGKPDDSSIYVES